MEERRKIVIPTDFDPEETLSRQYFDSEATLSARPVVPLSDAEATPPGSPAASASAAPAVAPAKKSARRWVVPAVIAAALVIGLVAGVGIIAYQRSRQPQQAETPQAVGPVAEKTRAVLPWTHTPDEVIPEDDSTAILNDTNATETARDNTLHENEARDEKRREQAEAAREDRRAQLEQQRDEREDRRQDKQQRRGRDERNRDDDLPQDPIIRRTQDELHRVREIFEGKP
jgi:hypothetical protein